MGRKAIQPTINTINRIKIINISTCNKLFRALVSSILLYAAPIWILRHIDELEKVQNIFYRKLLPLPRNTPGYSLRADTGMKELR